MISMVVPLLTAGREPAPLHSYLVFGSDRVARSGDERMPGKAMGMQPFSRLLNDSVW
jgi:hypothetical protein